MLTEASSKAPTRKARNGPAIEVAKDGKRFEGNYEEDERHGKFIEKDRNGQVTAKGHYERGRRYTE